jgi:hypothetical protein
MRVGPGLVKGARERESKRPKASLGSGRSRRNLAQRIASLWGQRPQLPHPSPETAAAQVLSHAVRQQADRQAQAQLATLGAMQRTRARVSGLSAERVPTRGITGDDLGTGRAAPRTSAREGLGRPSSTDVGGKIEASGCPVEWIAQLFARIGAISLGVARTVLLYGHSGDATFSSRVDQWTSRLSLDPAVENRWNFGDPSRSHSVRLKLGLVVTVLLRLGSASGSRSAPDGNPLQLLPGCDGRH